MLHFEGDQVLPQPPTEVWTHLTDARFLVGCIPGVEAISEIGPDTAVCNLRPGFSFVRGTLELSLRILPEVPGQLARVQLSTKGIGTTSAVETTMNFQPHEQGTQIHWTASIKELGGLLKAVPQGLLKAAAQKVIADAWATVSAKLGT